MIMSSQQFIAGKEQFAVQKINVAVFSITDPGTFTRNLTPSGWKNASLRERYLAATMRGLQIEGITVYRDCVIEHREGYKVYVADCRDAVVFDSSINTARDDLARYIGAVPTYLILTSAVALKDRVGARLNISLCMNIEIGASAEKRLEEADDGFRVIDLAAWPINAEPFVFGSTSEFRRANAQAAAEYRAAAERVRKQVSDDRKEVEHVHVCKQCNREYAHTHRGGEHEHDQRDYQCAYFDCPMFHAFMERDGLNTRPLEKISMDSRIANERFLNPNIRAVKCRCGAYRVNTAGAGERHKHVCRFEKATHQLREGIRAVRQQGLTVAEILEIFDEVVYEEPLQATAEGLTDGINREATRIANSTEKNSDRIADSAEKIAEEVRATGQKTRDFIDRVGTPLGDILDTINGWTLGNADFIANVTSLITDLMAGAYAEDSERGMFRLIFRVATLFGVTALVLKVIFSLCVDGVDWLVNFFASKILKAENVSETTDESADWKKRMHGKIWKKENESRQEMASRLQGHTTMPLVASAQAGTGIVGLISALTGASLLGAMPNDKYLKAASERLRFFNYAVPAAGHVESLIQYLVELIPTCVKEWICVISPSQQLTTLLTVDGPVRLWIKEVDAMELVKDQLIWKFDLQEKAEQLNEQGQKFLVDFSIVYKEAKDTSKVFSLITKYANQAKEYAHMVNRVRKDKAIRTTPFCLYITGPPGVGKSTIAKEIIWGVIPEDCPREQAIYSRNSSSKFWDGYTRQPVVLNDDFFQDIEARDVIEVISMISNNTYFPEFASLTDPKMGTKGTAFCSDLVVLLSNTPYPDVAGDIRSTDAFRRRRHLLVKMVPKEEARLNPGGMDMRIDPTKRDVENWTHVKFQILDPMDSQKPIIAEQTFSEFVMFFMTKYHEFMDEEKRVLAIQEKAGVVSLIRKQYEALKLENDRAKAKKEAAQTIKEFEAMKATAQGWIRNLWSTDDAPLKEVTPVTEHYEASFDDIVTDRCINEVNEMIIAEEAKRLEKLAAKDTERIPGWKKMSWIAAIIAAGGGVIWLLYKMYKRESAAWDKRGAVLRRMKAIPQSMSERTVHRRGADKRRMFIAQARSDYISYSKDFDAISKAFPRLENVNGLKSSLNAFNEELDCFRRAQDAGQDTDAWIDRLDIGISGLKEDLSGFQPDWIEVSTCLMEMSGQTWDETMRQLITSLYERESTEGVDKVLTAEYNLCMSSIGKRDRMGTAICCAAFLGMVSAKRATRDPTCFASIALLRDAGRLGLMTARAAVDKMPVCAQGVEDVQAQDLEDKLFVKNLFSLRMVTPDYERKMCGIMVRGSVGIFPRHFVTANGGLVPNGTIFEWKPMEGGAPIQIAFDSTKCVIMKDTNGKVKDVVAYDFGRRIRSYPNIVHHFPHVTSLFKYTHLSGSILVGSCDRAFPSLKTFKNLRPLTSVCRVGASYSFGGTQMQALDAWVYEAVTNAGDCGAPVVIHNPKLPEKIVGVHTFSVDGKGDSGGEVIAREYLEDALNQFEPQITGMPTPGGLGSIENAFPLLEATAQGLTTLTLAGTLPGNKVVRGATKTRIRRSPFYDRIVRHTKEPAVLSLNDERLLPAFRGLNPLVKGIEKFAAPSPPFDPEMLRRAIQKTKIDTLARIGSEPRFVATESEAINGMQQFSHCDALNMKSSAGWPYNLRRDKTTSGKVGLFAGEPGERVVVDEELRKALDNRVEKMSKREMVESVWTATLKDELRPIEKIAIGKTRTFIAPAVDNTIVSREYLLAFNSAMFRNHGRSGFYFAPGMDPQSFEWDAMVRDLLSTSDVGFSGDYGNYDGTLKAELMDGVREIVDAFYASDPFNSSYVDTPEAKNVRACLFNEYIHTTVLVGNNVTVKHAGNPSGCNCTTTINSVCNDILANYIWQCVAPPEHKDLIFKSKAVNTRVFGDDMIAAVRDWALVFFNAKTYAEECAKLGMEFTNADKRGEIVASEPVLNMTFLKQGFRLMDGRYVATLDMDSVHELFNWISETGEEMELCEENCSNALRFLWAYGPEKFGEYRDKIIALGIEGGYAMSMPEYSYFSAAYANTGKLPCLAYDAYSVTSYDEIDSAYMHESPLHVTPQMDQKHTGNGEYDEPTGDKAGEKVTTTAEMGIVQTEQVEVVKVEPVKMSTKSTIADQSSGDYLFTMASTVSKPHLVKTASWDTTQGVGTVLQAFTMPQEMISEDSVAHTPFLLHAYWRGMIEVFVTITGTKFNTGRLIMYWAPLLGKQQTVDRITTRQQETSLLHVFMDPADNSGAKMLIPFMHPHNYLNVRDPAVEIDFLGTLTIEVANQLRVGAGQPTTVGYSITVRFLEAEFQVQIPSEILPTRMSKEKIDKRIEKAARELRGLTKLRVGAASDDTELRHRTPISATAQGNVYTKNINLDHSIMKTEGNEASMSAELEATIPAALDFPNVNVNAPTVRRVGMGNFSNTTNIEFAERLALKPGDAKRAVTEEIFATKNDEMSLPYLFTLPNWDGIVAWNTTHAAGTPLYWRYMSPLPGVLAGDYNLGGARDFNSRDWASAKFSYWQGGLKLRLQLIASQYHTGRLFVSLLYGVYNDPTALTLDQITSAKGYYVDINSTKHDFEFDMPWLNNRSMLRIPNGTKPSGQLLDYVMGTYSIWVVEPLKMGPGVATEVDINVWNYSALDYQVSLLADNNATLIAASDLANHAPPALKATAEGDEVMATATSPTNINGERINHIMDILKRKQPVMTITNGDQGQMMPDIASMMFRMRRTQDPTNYLTNEYCGNTLFTWFCSAYRGWFGMVRFRAEFIPLANLDLIQPGETPAVEGFGLAYSQQGSQVNNDVAYSLTPQQRQLLGAYTNLPVVTPYNSQFVQIAGAATWSDPAVNVLDIECPFYGTEKFKIVCNGYSTDPVSTASAVATTGSLVVLLPGKNERNGGHQTYNGFLKLWISGGDDFRCGVYLGPPPLRLATQNIGYDTYPA